MDNLDFETQSGPARSIFLPIALALGACLIAVVAITLSLGAKGKNGQVSAQLHAAQLQITTLENRLKVLEAQTDELSDIDDAVMQQIKSMASQVETAFNQLSKEVSSQGEILEKMKNSGAVLKVARQAQQTSAKRKPAESPGIHAIQAGDTFGRLAQIYSVSLNELLAANPSVDPRRLQIGQQVVIPKKSE